MPRTLAQNAQYIAETIKPAIKSAIEAQGVTVPSTDSFLDYADRIAEIEGGGSGYQLKDLPTGSISTVNDATELPLNALKVSVEAWQEGTGDPSPSNIRPIHGWDSGEISVVGKNWLPRFTITDTQYGVTISGDSDGKVTVNGTVTGTNLYGFILNQTLVLTPNTYTLSGANQGGARLVLYDISDNVLADTDGTTTFTINNNTTIRLRLYVYSDHGLYDEVLEPMIRLVSESDATFEPYNSKTYTQQFPQAIYGAEWDVVDGLLDTQYGYMYANSAIGWVMPYETMFLYFLSDVKYSEGYVSTKSNQFNPMQNTRAWADIINNYHYGICVTMNSDNNIFIVICHPDITTLNAWEDFLSQHPLQVMYELATPTPIDLSPLSIRMLQGVNNLYADCGEVIEGEYFVGETKAYNLVEYIESDGTQVIDTGRQVVQGQTIEVTFEGSSNQTAYAWILGGITSSDYYGYQFPNSSTVYLYNGGTSASSQSGFASDVLTQKALTFNGSANANIHILGLWDGSAYTNQGKFKIYFLDIDGDYFVPAKRRSDGVYGLYDIANSQFLTDVAGGNALTGGASLGIRIG